MASVTWERWRSEGGYPILPPKVDHLRPPVGWAARGPLLRTVRPILPGGLRVALAALVAWMLAVGCQQEDPATAATKKAGAVATAPARTVRVVPAAETAVARTVSATGTLAADEQIVLGTKIVGRLAEIS